MDGRWTPQLRLRERSGRCRLTLAGCAAGEGATLQEAADDLIARLLSLAVCVRGSGLSVPRELGAPDRRWLDFVWELCELAAAGADIRERVFGPAEPPDVG